MRVTPKKRLQTDLYIHLHEILIIDAFMFVVVAIHVCSCRGYLFVSICSYSYLFVSNMKSFRGFLFKPRVMCLLSNDRLLSLSLSVYSYKLSTLLVFSCNVDVDRESLLMRTNSGGLCNDSIVEITRENTTSYTSWPQSVSICS